MREEVVAIDGWIPAVYVHSEVRQPASGHVLLLHGFASNRDEVGGMYRQLAAALAAVGIASLRIDLTTNGNVDDDVIPTIPDQLAQAARGLHWLNSRAGSPGHLAIVGFSLGAALAVELTAVQGDSIDGLVLWSPVGDVAADLGKSLGSAVLAAAEQDGTVEVDLGFRRIRLTDRFVTTRGDLGLTVERATSIQCPVGVIYGCDDPLCGYGETFRRGECVKVVLMEGVGHVLGGLDDTPDVRNQVVAQTVTWLERWLTGGELASGAQGQL